MVYQESLQISPAGYGAMQDLTSAVTEIIQCSGIATGTAQVFNVGSTGAVGTIEFEPGLQRDLPTALDRLLPPDPESGHEQTWQDGNGHSHLQATMLGPSLSVPVNQGRPRAGDVAANIPSGM